MEQEKYYVVMNYDGKYSKVDVSGIEAANKVASKQNGKFGEGTHIVMTPEEYEDMKNGLIPPPNDMLEAAEKYFKV